MNKIFESAMIALDAIWSAKLRSFMTVLGNIVAVTSIIAVVSLIQGLNASVKSAILNQAGADSFNIQQFPITRSDEEFEKVRGNPRISMDDMRAIRRYSSDLIAGVMADSSGRGRVTYRDKSIDNMQVQGVSPEYVNFSSFDAERGRLMSPTEVESARPVTVIGWQTADRLFGSDVDPIDKIDPDRRGPLPRRRRQRQARLAARPDAGRVRDHPARPVPDDLRIAPLAVAERPAARPGADRAGDRRGDRRAARGAAPQAEAAGQLRRVHRPTRSSTSTTRRPTASSPCWSASSRCRWWSAAS